MRPRKEKPHAGGRGAGAIGSMRALYGRHGYKRLPTNWRDRLPESAAYYGQHVPKLGKPNGEGWAQGRCPLHDDHDASLSVQASGRHGGWRCFAGCGKGDMVAFHMRLRGCGFKQAVVELVRGGA